jgi:hypothetical protein
MEAVSTSEPSVNIYQTTRINNSQVSHLQALACWKLSDAQMKQRRVIICLYFKVIWKEAVVADLT